MTFADWQRSRGITPWTEVQGWDETAYLVGLFVMRMADRIRLAMAGLAEFLATMAAAFGRVAAAIRPVLDSLA